jgi:hypothetical protein
MGDWLTIPEKCSKETLKMKKVILIQHAHLYFIYHNLPCTTILNFKHGLDSLDYMSMRNRCHG